MNSFHSINYSSLAHVWLVQKLSTVSGLGLLLRSNARCEICRPGSLSVDVIYVNDFQFVGQLAGIVRSLSSADA